MSYKFLLIDDDNDDRTFFAEAIAEISPDIECFTLDDGRKLLPALNSHKIEVPDIIFLDVNMPVMSGWECLSMLKSQEAYKDIPVIMYSTSSHSGDIKKAKASGAICLFTKPHYFVELKKALKDTFEHLITNSLRLLSRKSSLFAVPEE